MITGYPSARRGARPSCISARASARLARVCRQCAASAPCTLRSRSPCVIVSPVVSSHLPRARLHVNARTKMMRRDDGTDPRPAHSTVIFHRVIAPASPRRLPWQDAKGGGAHEIQHRNGKKTRRGERQGERTGKNTERNPRRVQPDGLSTRRRRNTRNPGTDRPRQMAGMATARLPHRKTPAMERTRRLRVDRPASRITSGMKPLGRIQGRGAS